MARNWLSNFERRITEHVANDKQKVLLALCDEIDQDISLDTLSRLSDYTRLGGVDNMPVLDRVALGVGGWLMGSGAGLRKSRHRHVINRSASVGVRIPGLRFR